MIADRRYIWTLLAASLCLNGFLVWNIARNHAEIHLSQAKSAETNQILAKGSKPAVAKNPPQLRRIEWANSGISDIIAELRKLGAPPEVLMAAAIGLTRKEFALKRAAILYPNGIPRYASSRPNAEQLDEIKKLVNSRVDNYKEILGADFQTSSLDEDPIKLARYGNLPEDKLEKVDRIFEDYQQIAANAGVGHGYKDLDADFAADIKAVLTPEEANDFLLYNSPSALELQRRLAGLDMSDALYRSTYAAVLAQEPDGVTHSPLGASVDAKVLATALPANSVMQVIDRENPSFAQIDSILGEAGVSGESRVNAFTTFNDVISLKDPTQRQQEAANLYQTMTSGLDPQSKVKFDGTSIGRYLKKMR